MQESLGRRTSSTSDQPIKLNNFSKSETVLNKFAAKTNGVASRQAQQASSVQTVAAASPPKGNGFCLSGPVTDL